MFISVFSLRLELQIQVLHFNRSAPYSLCPFTGLGARLEMNVALWLEMYGVRGNIVP